MMTNLLAFMATVIQMKVLKSLATDTVPFEHFKFNIDDERLYEELTEPYNNEAEIGMKTV